jgi:hypothetical protein
MQSNGPFLNGFSTGTFKATYNAWNESTSPSFSLSNYNPYAFPFDTYQTPEIIIALAI